MDEIRLDRSAYDPAYANAMLREARRMRNAALVDLVKALFDGRLTSRLFDHDAAARHALHKGAAAQG